MGGWKYIWVRDLAWSGSGEDPFLFVDGSLPAPSPHGREQRSKASPFMSHRLGILSPIWSLSSKIISAVVSAYHVGGSAVSQSIIDSEVRGYATAQSGNNQRYRIDNANVP